MAALIGTLLDVSGSMRRNVDKTNESWARCIFDTLDQVISNEDISDETLVFALCFGGEFQGPEKRSIQIPMNQNFLNAESLFRKLDQCAERGKEREVFDLLKSLENAIKPVQEIRSLQKDIQPIANELKDLIQKGYEDRIPEMIRDSTLDENIHKSLEILQKNYISNSFENQERMIHLRRVLNEFNEKIDVVKSKIEESCCAVIPRLALKNVHDASYIIKTISGIDRKEKLTSESIDKLMETIEPYIYGGTPLYRTLHLAKQILTIPGYEDHKKLLIIVSDGEPADKDIYDRHLEDNVTVVCCFITENPISNALHFYAKEQPEWEKGAKFMYNLSSKIPLQNIPNVVFADQDWTFDFSENNDTKLFAQVNHPDMINKMCEFAQDLVFCQDSLSEVISTVDVYINQTQFELQRPTNQGEDPTCYAHAAAAVIHLATTRIVGRNYGLDQIRKDILEQFTPEGCKGADTAVVLENVCPKYGLRVKKISLKDAKIAISEKRPVLARIAFNENTIGEFYNFFLQSKSATLSKENYTICDGKEVFGHAAVFVGYNSKSLRFMNTWGCEWGDNGFFRVKDVDVFDICEFYDVYFDETDLTTIEKEEFKYHGKELTRLHLDKLKSLKEATHKCHLCQHSSKVLEYTGDFNNVQCPKCRQNFKAREGHPDIFLAIYLTSLAHTEQR